MNELIEAVESPRGKGFHSVCYCCEKLDEIRVLAKHARAREVLVEKVIEEARGINADATRKEIKHPRWSHAERIAKISLCLDALDQFDSRGKDKGE